MYCEKQYSCSQFFVNDEMSTFVKGGLQITFMLCSKSLIFSLGGALFALSVATSLVNLGLDVILKVKGCCFFYRSICRNTKEFNRRSKKLAADMKKLNIVNLVLGLLAPQCCMHL